MNDDPTYPQIAAIVYQACANYDPYLPPLSPDLAQSWGKAFEKYALRLDDLLAAVDRIYAEQIDCQLRGPGRIVQSAREIRHDHTQREDEAQRRAREDAFDQRVAVARAEQLRVEIANTGAAKAVDDDEPKYTRPSQSDDPAVTARVAALRVRCPHCHANAGQHCHNSATGTRLRNLPAHHDRIAVAEGRPPTTPRSESSASFTARQHEPPADPCLRCGQWIRLGPEARKSENPRWCGECNFDQAEFMRLREQDELLGEPVRTRVTWRW